MRRNLWVLIVALSGSAASAAVYNGPGGAIPDGANTSGTVFGEAALPITISGDGGTVVSINSVTLTNITHTWIGDLQFLLRAPNGTTTVSLLAAPDNNPADLGGTYVLVVDPSVPTLAEAAQGLGGTTAVPSGTYAISAFGTVDTPGPRTTYVPLTGQNVDGQWTLLLRDWYLNDVGSIGSWSLDLTSSAVPEPGSLIVLAGVGLLGFRRRARR